MDRNEMRGEINRLNYILNEKKKSTDETNFVKDLIKLELKIMAALASLKIIPRNEAINKAFDSMKENDVLCLLAKGEDKYQQVRGKLEDYISDVGMAKKLTENL